MMCSFRYHNPFMLLLLAVVTGSAVSASAADNRQERLDYLSFAQGAIPVAIEGSGSALRVGMEHALQAIDGNGGGYSLTPKPGAAETSISFVYKLPALTTFAEFAIPNVLETPSPWQTFIRGVEISGSDVGAEGSYRVLGRATLQVHSKKGETTTIPVIGSQAVRWVRVTLEGGLDVQRDKTFFEFSEIIGYGSQEVVPMSKAFSGKWKGRGVKLELKQEDARVTGCYDGVGDLSGTVSGAMLRAMGQTRDSGISSTFVLAVGKQGEIVGVRSTNGAPFKLYAGESSPGLTTECSERSVELLGCGSVIHGINFDFDSATIRPESSEVLDALAQGLKASKESTVTVIGHTSSEGSDAYNEKLSQRRAESVVAAVIARGIKAERISAEGRGEKQPIAENKTEAGRSLNRRVEISCH